MLGRFPVTVTSTTPQPTLLASAVSLPGLASAAGAAATPGEIGASPLPLTVTAPATVQDQVVSAENGTAQSVAVLADQQRAATVSDGSGTVTAARAERMPIFFEYQVQEGDTVGAIATRYHIAPDYILWNNNDISDRDVLTVGTTLQIPSVEGIIHSVRYGETVSEIATRYGADPRDIVEFAANGLQDDPNSLHSDSLILVPGGKKLPAVAPSLRPTPGVAAPAATDSWVWPASGPITSYFGPSHPLGIDVGAPWGAPVVAARAGTVVFAGGNPCCSYGYHVIIDHGDGYETTYAHFSSMNVVPGQHVSAGDLLGAIGETGHATGPHLHFEITRNGVIQNPMGPGFLP